MKRLNRFFLSPIMQVSLYIFFMYGTDPLYNLSIKCENNVTFYFINVMLC